ncbi:MAG: threonine--tRNA ligase [Planctomycetia bacterium]|nr:threonine--tRNA ligase [Planctomycetia bacterium]
MPTITLPDGSQREYDSPVTGEQLAGDIGERLLKASIGIVVDGAGRDLSSTISEDASVSIITSGSKKEEPALEALSLIRHSCAHVMAEAIERVIPGSQLVYGPPTDQGFYYDIRFPEDHPMSSDDFPAIEKEMSAIISENRPFTRYELNIEEGLEKVRGEGSKYKIDNAERAIEAGSAELSWYVSGQKGENWEDLCRGPHVPSTGKIGAFKLMSVASAYWHGDADSDGLTRVYGTAFAFPAQLNRHLERLEEAKRRDHRVIGRRQNLFKIDDSVGQGLVLWQPNGSVIRRELEEFIREHLIAAGYDMVYTPHVGKLGLYRTSGHFPYYRESQFPPLINGDFLEAVADEGCSCAELSSRIGEGEVDGFMLKPMNCPHHIKVFDAEPRSYRDLPVRLAEFGTVYRWEQSGELNGLTRVRGFTQDDAHLFCTEDQVADEIRGCLDLVKLVLTTLGLQDYRVRVGLRDKDSTKYTGDPERWDRAEQACRDAATTLGVPFSEEEGEAAFYGPKIDFVVSDAIGREWQLGTVQVDYNLPERFDLSYTGADNASHRPVMVHRAPFGSFERFIGILIEHFEGSFPTWLSPEQARVLPISEKHVEYGEEVLGLLKGLGVRAKLDDSNERLNAKIKVAADEKVPYLLVVGGKDAEARTVSVRQRGIGDIGAIDLDQFLQQITDEIQNKRLPASAEKSE